jgi:hypothetical protein
MVVRRSIDRLVGGGVGEWEGYRYSITVDLLYCTWSVSITFCTRDEARSRSAAHSQ